MAALPLPCRMNVMKTAQEILREGEELLTRLRKLEKQEIELIDRLEQINNDMGALLGVRRSK